MQPDGDSLIARWRELGEWWAGEPYREYTQFFDRKGIRREKVEDLGALLRFLDVVEHEAPEDHREDWSLRVHKKRDEKMALARLSYESVPPPVHRTPRVHTTSNVYAPLHVLTGYAFGRGTMMPEEIAMFTSMIGCPAVGVADPYSLTGAVEFARACAGVGIKPLIGATIELKEQPGELVLIARSKVGYQSLSQLITACHLEEPRSFPCATWNRLELHSRDLMCLTGGDVGPINLLLLQRRDEEAGSFLRHLSRIYGSRNVFVEIERSFNPWQISLEQRLLDLADDTGLTCIAGGPITHARKDHGPVQDMLVCIDSLCTIDEIIGRKPRVHAGRPERPLNAERYLREAEDIQSLFADKPHLLSATLEVADRCDSDVMPSRTKLPDLYDDPNHALREATWMGAHLRYEKVTPRLRRRIETELMRIQRLNFSGHFLTMWDACRWAHSQQIQFSGRGSVVDSVVAYCLGFSRIDAMRHNLHFDRFLPEDGSKRPDIDIDFEAARRNDVRNYLTDKYGKHKVATVSAVGAYCTRGIIREVGKVLGIPNELITYINKRLHGGITPDRLSAAMEKRPELRESGIDASRLNWVFALAERMMDLPRNIRAHSSGVVISQSPLCETVPVMLSGVDNVQIVQWDKRSAKHYFDKFDILCLRGQDVLSGTEQRVRLSSTDFSVESLPLDDPHTYAAMRSGELIGIPQSASPAMRQAHMRLRTQDLHDASLVQAGIRPGVGGAVKLNEMIARKRGKPFSFMHPDLEQILGVTYGIVVFQEQIDQLLQTFCGCSSGEAEDIREAIHKKRKEEFGEGLRSDLISRIVARGYTEPVANEVVELVAGFKGYGFAQGHALAFAEISIRSIYCQQNYPAEYFAAILDAQPAGYYGPCTLANEARNRGVCVLPPDVNRSEKGFQVEELVDIQSGMVIPHAGLRVGLNQVNGLSEELKQRIVDASISPTEHAQEDTVHETRTSGVATLVREAQGTSIRKRFQSLFEFIARLRPDRDELEALILCGAFDSLNSNRRQLLWSIPRALEYTAYVGQLGGLPLEFHEPDLVEGIIDFDSCERAIYERVILGMDIQHHLMAFERSRVASKGGITAAEARALPDRQKGFCVGSPIRLRFPPTPSGKRVVFFDLEDESGLLNVTCFDAVYQRDGHAIVCSPFVTVVGHAQHRDEHVAFLATRVFPYKPQFMNLPDKPNEFCCR